jgi:hypothetical protein
VKKNTTQFQTDTTTNHHQPPTTHHPAPTTTTNTVPTLRQCCGADNAFDQPVHISKRIFDHFFDALF